jgi:hypothetical protein
LTVSEIALAAIEYAVVRRIFLFFLAARRGVSVDESA